MSIEVRINTSTQNSNNLFISSSNYFSDFRQILEKTRITQKKKTKKIVKIIKNSSRPQWKVSSTRVSFERTNQVIPCLNQRHSLSLPLFKVILMVNAELLAEKTLPTTDAELNLINSHYKSG